MECADGVEKDRRREGEQFVIINYLQETAEAETVYIHHSSLAVFPHFGTKTGPGSEGREEDGVGGWVIFSRCHGQFVRGGGGRRALMGKTLTPTSEFKLQE